MADFDTAERLAIVAEWQRQAAAWQPWDGHGYGCLMVIVAVVLGILVPKLGGMLPPTLKTIGLVLIPILGVGGFLVMQVRFLPGDTGQISDDALALLASGAGEAEAHRRAAVALLFHAWDQRGPTLSTGYDHAAAREKLGAGLDYVQSVEQVLRDELKIAPVFTN